jgi:hypothetical protein
MLKGKKADFTDPILIVIILFFLAVSLVTSAFVVTKLKLVIQNTPLNDTEQAADIIASMDTLVNYSTQNAYMFIFAFLVIGTIVSSFMVKVHPVWFFLYILFGGLGVLLAVFLSNTYNAFINAGAILSVAAQQTKINYVMQHSVEIMIGVVALGAIVMFSRGGGAEPV